MRGKRVWSRRSLTLRNLGLLLVLLCLLWAVLGYPSLSARQALRRGEESLLVEGFEVVAHEKRWADMDVVYGRRGNQFLEVRTYDLSFWPGIPQSARLYDTEDGVLCAFDWRDTVEVLGDIDGAADGKVVLSAPGQKSLVLEDPVFENGLMRFESRELLQGSDAYWEHVWTAELTLYDQNGEELRILTLPWRMS